MDANERELKKIGTASLPIRVDWRPFAVPFFFSSIAPAAPWASRRLGFVYCPMSPRRLASLGFVVFPFDCRSAALGQARSPLAATSPPLLSSLPMDAELLRNVS